MDSNQSGAVGGITWVHFRTQVEMFCNFRQFGFKKMMGIFFRLDGSSGPMCTKTESEIALHNLQNALFFSQRRVNFTRPDLKSSNLPFSNRKKSLSLKLKVAILLVSPQ